MGSGQQKELDRCRAEIRRIQAEYASSSPEFRLNNLFLFYLGMSDWSHEELLILKESSCGSTLE